eukprot:CAMPEP_0118951156 /NCGR_PEP_ID=MMETSP1169-20130426/52632_1 /TAXON_ID=36882 /ORGANISM="Pyramimonas obovata, Strain CCMP722" /LENGTH=169 /DNA_ID=CAMNT_0006898159 /DNA_START=86 /DNA_END=596 /DNA_ORIENTATION=+
METPKYPPQLAQSRHKPLSVPPLAHTPPLPAAVEAGNGVGGQFYKQTHDGGERGPIRSMSARQSARGMRHSGQPMSQEKQKDEERLMQRERTIQEQAKAMLREKRRADEHGNPMFHLLKKAQQVQTQRMLAADMGSSYKPILSVVVSNDSVTAVYIIKAGKPENVLRHE